MAMEVSIRTVLTAYACLSWLLRLDYSRCDLFLSAKPSTFEENGSAGGDEVSRQIWKNNKIATRLSVQRVDHITVIGLILESKTRWYQK